MKKMIAADLDGTLLDSTHQIPKENCQAIRQLYKQGVTIVIATGRGEYSVKKIFRELGVDGYLIGQNGAHISKVTAGETKLLFSDEMSKADVMTAYQLFLNSGVTMVANTLKNSYRASRVQDKQVIQEFQHPRPDLVEISVEEMKEVLAHHEKSFLKIAFTSTAVPKLETFKGQLAERGLQAFFSDRNYIELVADGVSKGAALKQLCQYLGINSRDTIAFGDQENDLEMIENSGTGVAMGNGNPNVQAIADKIAGTNDEAGVGRFLKQFFQLD